VRYKLCFDAISGIPTENLHKSNGLQIGYKHIMLKHSLIAKSPYIRPKWLGYGRLMPGNTIIDTLVWSPEKIAEYEEAFEVQRNAIEKAIDLESVEEKERRRTWCGACAPDHSDSIVDLFVCMAEKMGAIQLKKGFIMGLEHATKRDESMLTQAKQDLCTLHQLYVDFVKSEWSRSEKQLMRQNICVFIKEDKDDDYEEQATTVEHGSVNTSKRRLLSKARGKQPILVETHEYWLERGNLVDGMQILSKAM